MQTVRQAVIAWAQRLGEKKDRGASFELATTLIGSGGTGISAGESARLVAQGVYEANQLLNDARSSGALWPRVGRLRMIELYLDRAVEAWRALRLQEKATPDRYKVDESVKTAGGAMQRPPDSGYRGADYDFVTVETVKGEQGEPLIVYKLDTGRARSEVRGQCAQSQLLRELISSASSDRNRDTQIGRTLFDLLIPIELEAYLSGSGEMQIELDTATAGIPWELLDTSRESDASQVPWSIRVKLLRKLRIADFRERIVDADADANALVIGEPECSKNYPRLAGARMEALAVQTSLTGPDGLEEALVKTLISENPAKAGANARTVINTLFERPWRILHIAGHGAPPSGGSQGGVVLSNDSFLGPAEIRNLRVVPELVFVNCCHLASGDPDQVLSPPPNSLLDRATFASGVARALIEIGVRCVVAAGWAVDDDAAAVFAENFYGALLRGSRFIEAVGAARTAAYNASPHSNTWAAYQCYGDADWVFRRKAPDADQVLAPRVTDYSHVGSIASLKLALERIVVETKYQGADRAERLLDLRELEKQFTTGWGANGSVAELFGEAFTEVGAIESGMHWYERAVSAPDGRASMKAAEQLANVRGRFAWERVDAAARHRDDMAARAADRTSTPKARAAARRARADAGRKLREVTAEGRTLIRQSLDLLGKLTAVESTMERESLIGSAHKRAALVDAAAGRQSQVDRSLRRMKAAYALAMKVGRRSGNRDLFYPASNCVVADVALNGGRRGWRGVDRALLAGVRESLKAKSRQDADFWSLVGAIELDQWDALAKRRLKRARPALAKAYQDLYKRVKAARMWASVYDTACLVLANYAARSARPERLAAQELLVLLRSFAHPESTR